MRNKLRNVGLGMLSLGCVVVPQLIAPQAAEAVPYGCHYEINGRDVIGTCSKGSGQFRLRLDCSHAPDRYSNWTNAGKQATARCLAGMPFGISFETH